MYTSYFGFKENPFSLTPDPNYLYLSRTHKEAFDHLLYGINERKGFIVITGGIGTGKTTLCRALLGTLDSSTKTALIFNAYISDMELLSTINQEFGIGASEPGLSKKDHIDSLNRFLLETFSRGGNAVLLIDEAQNLSHTVLEQIRMLSNLETEKEKLVQIVLAGQSELREFLASSALRQLDERIMVRYDLKPLDKTEVKGYVEHRLVVAGSKGNVRFTRGAFDAIYAYSLGNPRRINGVCDRALIIAYSKDEFTISKKMVQKAIEDMRGDVTFQPRLATRIYWKSAWLSIPLLLLIIVAGFGGWNFRKEISALISGEVAVTSTPSLPSVREQDTDRLKGEREYRGNGERLPNDQEITAPENKKVLSALPEQESQAASLFLDEQASFGGLFRLFNEQERDNTHGANKVYLGLYSCYVNPKQYIMFKKPFRVRVDRLAHHPDLSPAVALPLPRYLLVREVTADGAIAIDAEGKERLITKDFILTHWGQEVSWVYPYEKKKTRLEKGMRGPDVTKLQQTLNELGYSVEPTGLYDESTFQQVIRLQDDFALMADGIVGTRTKGLLYQMLD
jgi:general secretion pathway protein A